MDDNNKSFSNSWNYCQKCWNEFTTLTEQERFNLKQIKKLRKFFNEEYDTRHRKVFCEENGKVYESFKEASEDTGVNDKAIYFACRRYDPNKRSYKKEWHFRYF